MIPSPKMSLRSPATMWPAPSTSITSAWGTKAANRAAPSLLSTSLEAAPNQQHGEGEGASCRVKSIGLHN